MEKVRKDKLVKLQEKIKEYKEILKSEDLLKEQIEKNYRFLRLKTFIASLTCVGISTLTSKGLGFGLPIVKEELKTYQDIVTTVDNSSTITQDKNGYNCPDYGGLAGICKEGNYLYNYSDWAKTITDNYIRYIDKYDLNDISIDEVINVLNQDKIDIKSLYKVPETIADVFDFSSFPETIIQTEYTEEELQENAYIKAIFHDIDENDYIYDVEPDSRNEFATIWSFSIPFIPILVLCGVTDHKLTMYKNEYLKLFTDTKTKYEEKLRKEQQKLERKRKI